MKFLIAYKEIFFGVGLGGFAWLVDAVMHVELGADVHAGGLWQEVFTPHPTALVFRTLFVVVAIAFGIFLWRANWRERQLRALEEVVVSFQRHLDAPALRILVALRSLRNRNSVLLDDTANDLVNELGADAKAIDELARKYLDFARLVRRGETARAIELLRSVEKITGSDRSVKS